MKFFFFCNSRFLIVASGSAKSVFEHSFVVSQHVATVDCFSCASSSRLLDAARMNENTIQGPFVQHVAVVVERESQDRSMAGGVELGRVKRR